MASSSQKPLPSSVATAVLVPPVPTLVGRSGSSNESKLSSNRDIERWCFSLSLGDICERRAIPRGDLTGVDLGVEPPLAGTLFKGVVVFPLTFEGVLLMDE